jgi:hypothetical protein
MVSAVPAVPVVVLCCYCPPTAHFYLTCHNAQATAAAAAATSLVLYNLTPLSPAQCPLDAQQRRQQQVRNYYQLNISSSSGRLIGEDMFCYFPLVSPWFSIFYTYLNSRFFVFHFFHFYISVLIILCPLTCATPTAMPSSAVSSRSVISAARDDTHLRALRRMISFTWCASEDNQQDSQDKGRIMAGRWQDNQKNHDNHDIQDNQDDQDEHYNRKNCRMISFTWCARLGGRRRRTAAAAFVHATFLAAGSSGAALCSDSSSSSS